MHQKYAEYKDSGVEWLGEIPSHWTSIAIKFLAKEKNSLFLDGDWIESKDISENGVRYITTGNVGEGFYKEQGMGYITETTFKKLSCTEVFPNDILISRLNVPIGRACLVPDLESRVVTSVDNVIFRPDSEYYKNFLVYLFTSKDYFRHTENVARGATMQRISRGLLGNIRVVIPSKEEQIQISNFLDHETAKIDSLIAKQEKLIELLKEKRQAVISHAVTKGLNPDVPMKDSGVEWLGQVPEHWGITKLKWKALTTSGSTPTTSKYELYYENGNIPWIRTTDLNNSDLYETPISITSKGVYDTACSILPINSILIAMYGGAGSIGKHALLKFESTINQAVCGVLPSKYFNSDYLHRFYEFYRPFWMIGAMGTRKDPNIGQDHIKEATVLLPPLKEQEKIAKYILDIQLTYDNLTNRAEAAIHLMQERRTALISAAVTGKIDVQNWQNPNNNNEAKTEFSA